MKNLYAERDAMQLDQAGGFYCQHVRAMTAEGLHSKSDIAAELGWRDMQIAKLESYRIAFTEWHNKTGWVQGDKRFDVIRPWGKHRADAMKLYIEHLESKLVALAAENAGLKNALEWLYETVSSESVSVPDEKYSSVTNAAQVLSETPATNAFLAEVRAQGVEMLRKHPAIKLCSLTHVCDEFAAQLRKGVQS